MTPEEMDQVRPRLVAFAAGMFGGLPRSDQRVKGELYLRGLMLDGRRKSMQPMAARLGHASAAETLDTYSHLWPDSDDRTRAAVDAILGRVADSVRTAAHL